MKLILLLNLLVILGYYNAFGFKSKFKQLKELASKFQKKEKNNWIVIDENENDYPGTNNINLNFVTIIEYKNICT